jgi:ABC-type nitrate/sulfonate/bicarbonate transport system ATPase subunit
MEALDIASVARHYPAELSGGQRQRVAIARTLLWTPTCVNGRAFCLAGYPYPGEPAGPDTGFMRQGQPSTMVLVSHNIEESVYWGNRILVLEIASAYSAPDRRKSRRRFSILSEHPGVRFRLSLLRDLLGEAMTPENTLKNKAVGQL